MNAVIYARYSSYGQNEQSIEGQLKDCHAYAVREGMTVVGGDDEIRTTICIYQRDAGVRFQFATLRRTSNSVYVKLLLQS